MLEIRNLSFAYSKNKEVLKDVSFKAIKGEVLGILGPNGTGKTTLIKCINRILPIGSGEILIENFNIKNLKQKEVAQRIAYVPQYSSSFVNLNVIDTVMMGRVPYVTNKFSEKDMQIVIEILKKMNLEKFAFTNIKEMSGGERQLVYIARAMAQEPQIIILDEPTSSLDLSNQLFVMQKIVDLAKQKKIAVLISIHDLNLAAMFCDKILMLNKGNAVIQGSIQEVLTAENIEKIYRVKTEILGNGREKYVRILNIG